MKREYNLVIEDNHCDCPKQEQQHYYYQNMQYHLIKLNSILQLF